MKLDWQPFPHSDSMVGYSGKVDVAIAVKRIDGVFYWKIDGVFTKWIAKGSGEAKSMAAAKRAADRVWGKWLAAAELEARKQ